jgi:hypothetical protein
MARNTTKSADTATVDPEVVQEAVEQVLANQADTAEEDTTEATEQVEADDDERDELPAQDEKATPATTDEEWITPYKAAKLINEQLGLDIPPQMVYTYVKNGSLDSNEEKRVQLTTALEWAKELQERRNKRATAKKAQEDKERSGDDKAQAKAEHEGIEEAE